MTADIAPLTLDPGQQRAVFRLIDATPLVRLMREDSLNTAEVRALLDLWSQLDPIYGPRADGTP